ncbi:MAG: DUF4906 domain-containing protein [Bacteroidales bacterium]|nr:DUF4906 domain-containing protein [Bacteroidales bacterium]
MDRKRKYYGALLTLFLASCAKVPVETPVLILTGLMTRSDDPDENMISDVNLLVYDEQGILEGSHYFPSAGRDGELCRLPLVAGSRYSFYVIANVRYQFERRSEEELLSYIYHMAYPDEYTRGIPMTGSVRRKMVTGGSSVEIPLLRTMAKVSVRMDRNALEDGTEISVKSIEVGACPSVVALFRDSAVKNESEVFNIGFRKTGMEADDLNRGSEYGLSREISLYMLENLQGARHSACCSFVEIIADCKKGEETRTLSYRFYLGEMDGNYDIRRGCHYHYTVKLPPDGGEGGWSTGYSVEEAR